MNICLRSGLCAVALVALAGCASSGGMASTASSPDVIQRGDVLVTDTAYIETVENIARRRGVAVQWLNPPLKRLAGGVSQ